MHSRIKEVRKRLSLSQEDFACRLGITGSGLSNIEGGKRKVTEQMVLSICREFNVNEEWLRNGYGEMFVESDDTNISAVVSEFSLDELSQTILKAYVEMDESKRSAFNFFAKTLADSVMNDSKEKAINGINDIIDNSSIPGPVKINLHDKVTTVFDETFPYVEFKKPNYEAAEELDPLNEENKKALAAYKLELIAEQKGVISPVSTASPLNNVQSKIKKAN